jgi:hypothetical protein
MFDQTISQLLLFAAMAAGAIIASMWLGIVLWTYRDMRARSRDPLAQGAATLMVVVLGIFGLILYLMLRPRETLTEAYERSLEEEALLQGIEEKPVCPGCGRPSNALWQVCPHCHTRLKKPCIQCGQLRDSAGPARRERLASAESESPLLDADQNGGVPGRLPSRCAAIGLPGIYRGRRPITSAA